MRTRRGRLTLAATTPLLALCLTAAAQSPTPTPAPAPEKPAAAPAPKPPSFAMVKVNDDTWFRLGFLLQPQADFLQDAATSGYAQNYFIRRVRVLLAGSIVKDVSFFFETDTPNAGKTVGGTKTSTTMTVQDAYVEWKIANEFQLGGGLFLVPLARNTLQSAASLMTLDYGAYSFSFSAPTQNVVGRDTGFHARGYLAGNHFEYRVGVFQGQRDAASRQSPRFMARVMYNVFDTETAFFYTGTNLGKKKILAFGAAFDAQKDYRAVAGDLFLDLPIAGGNAFTVQGDFIKYDGGRTFTALPEQNTLHTEAGFYIGSAKVTPYVVFDLKDVDNTDTGDEKRYGFGLAFFRNGHNFNLKAQYQRIDPKVGASVNQFTLQMQGFYF
jgi:Phosphate-selective porin O and P